MTPQSRKSSRSATGLGKCEYCVNGLCARARERFEEGRNFLFC